MRIVTLAHQTDFAGWRQAARRLIVDDIAPEDVSWSVGAADTLFAPKPSSIATSIASRCSIASCGACVASTA